MRPPCAPCSQGYFQPDVGGETIPVAEGELSDLAGDEPLFKALYKWCAFLAGVSSLEGRAEGPRTAFQAAAGVRPAGAAPTAPVH
jgi:hypothetical protein